MISLWSSDTEEENLFVSIVCQANYCRSPVAEAILKSRFQDNIHFDSSGLSPYPDSSMDPRSRDFLIKKGYEVAIHNPKMFTNHLAKASSIVLAADTNILFQLNSQFKNMSHKFRVLSFKHRDIPTSDPFSLDKEKYYEVMCNIEKICNDFKTDDFILKN